MTPNQVILLLDCHRGFQGRCHAGTLPEDRRLLHAAGLIDEHMHTTILGRELVEAICKKADDGLMTKEQRLDRINARIARQRELNLDALAVLIAERESLL